MVALLPITNKKILCLKSGWMSSDKRTERCCTNYSGGYSSHSALNIIPVLGGGITIFSVQMATSGVANRV